MGEREQIAGLSPGSSGLLAIAGAALGWALGAVAARDLFDAGVTPVELVLARAAISAVGFGALALRHRFGRRMARPKLVALGLSIALVNVTYYEAIARLAIAVALVLQYTAPVLVVTWHALRVRRLPSPEIVTALVAALVGVVFVAELPAGDIGALDTLGLVFGLASAILFATYTLLSHEAGEIYGPVGAMARAFGIAAVFWVVFQIPNGWPGRLVEPGIWPSVLLVGVVGTLIPFFLFVWGIGRVRAERAAIAATLEPLFAAALAWTLLGQSLSAMQVGGGIVIIGAVAALQVLRKGPVQPPEPVVAPEG